MIITGTHSAQQIDEMPFRRSVLMRDRMFIGKADGCRGCHDESSAPIRNPFTAHRNTWETECLCSRLTIEAPSASARNCFTSFKSTYYQRKFRFGQIYRKRKLSSGTPRTSPETYKINNPNLSSQFRTIQTNTVTRQSTQV